MDNYEWLDGYKSEAKFGLCRIDYNESDEVPANLRRQLTRGAEALKLILEKSSLETKIASISNTSYLDGRRKVWKIYCRWLKATSYQSEDKL